MAGYTRQSAANMITGAVIFASDLNAELNQLQSAFSGSTGHAHDGTTGNGPKVSLTASVSGTLPIANGGTNAVTAAAARTSLFGVSTTVDNTIARYDGTTGLLQGSGVTIDDSDQLTAVNLFVNGITGTNRQIVFSTSGSSRWIILANGTAESGSNAGSDFTIASRTDAGTALGSPFTIARSTGITTINSLVANSVSSPNVAITGGTISGITDLAIADGGTGASNAASALSNLGGQPLDATLTSLAAYNTAGLITQTAADTFTGRTVTGTAAEITVTNGNGVSGNPTLSLPAALTFTGKTVTGGTFTSPSITGGSVTGITDLAIADGGTGASTAVAALVNLGVNPLNGFKNKIINSRYTIDQDSQAGVTSLSAGQQWVDGWKGGAGGCTLSLSAGVVTIATGTLVQIIDGSDLETGTHTINWVGTSTCTVDAVAKVKTATFTLTRGTNSTIIFAPGTLSFAQVEPGSVATAFEQRPDPIEHLICRWRFEVIQVVAGGYQGVASVNFVSSVPGFPKRATPTITNKSTITSSNVASASFINISTQGATYSVVGTAAGTATVTAVVLASIDARL